jgi:membrane protein DedA with SNARE-associated domain
METLEGLVTTYGPAVIFVGTFLEGETIVVVAGFLAHQGIIDPFAVAASAFLGSFLGDQFWFYLGRRHAEHPLATHITRHPLFTKVASAIEDHRIKFILTFRFIYGIRTISPVAVGLTDIPTKEFLLLNAIAAVIWAIAFTALGYLFGKAVETVLGDIKAIEHKIFAAAGIALAIFVIYQIGWRTRRRFKRKPASANKSEDTGPL